MSYEKGYQMSEKRKEYIDQLLLDLRLLEERLLAVKENDTLPFSFFGDSFDRVERISRSLHELELMQIGEMKEQMERLVRFLSESTVIDSTMEQAAHFHEQDLQKSDLQQPDPQEPELHLPEEQSELLEQSGSIQTEYSLADTDRIVIEQEKVILKEKIILPEYRNPRAAEPASAPRTGTEHTGTEHIISDKNGSEKTVIRSLNDIIQAPPALLDLKRGISLNDRFLFQRELFNNNREGMNEVMDRLNSFGNFEEAESFLTHELKWDFENQTVKEFLVIIKKGFA